MTSFFIVLWAEGLKAWRSKVFLVTAIFFAFIASMLSLLVFVAGHPEIAGRSAVVSAKAALIGKGDWPSFFNLLDQVVLALGALGSGVVTSWVFGREYSDRTMKDILVLPLERTTIVLAKIAVSIIWSVLLCLILLGVAVVAGVLFQIRGWDGNAMLAGAMIYLKGCFFTMLLCTPIAFVANLGRGYLLPVGFTILTMMMTQLFLIGLPEAIEFVPWALPALVCGIAGQDLPTAGVTAYSVYFLMIGAGLAGTMLWWQKADHV